MAWERFVIEDDTAKIEYIFLALNYVISTLEESLTRDEFEKRDINVQVSIF